MRHLHRCPRCKIQHACGRLDCEVTPEHEDRQRHGVTYHGGWLACPSCHFIVLAEKMRPFNRVERVTERDGSITLVCDVDGEPLKEVRMR